MRSRGIAIGATALALALVLVVLAGTSGTTSTSGLDQADADVRDDPAGEGSPVGDDADGGSGEGRAGVGGRNEKDASRTGDGVSAEVVDLGLVDACEGVLAEYQEGEAPCVLARAGYVDLLGEVWSCTVVGDGWVDTVVVRSLEGDERSEVRTVRMDAAEWEDEAPVP